MPNNRRTPPYAKHPSKHGASTAKKNHAPVFCSVCNNSEIAKYKCPKCRAPYCSVACCKSHKESSMCVTIGNDPRGGAPEQIRSKYADHVLPASEVAEKIKRRKAMASRGTEEEEDEWRLTPKIMSKLDENDWVRNEVRSDGGLRQIIVDIDSASDREKALNEAKVKYPMFAKFVKNMLLCAGILVEDDEVPGGLRLVDTQRQIEREKQAISYHNSGVSSDDDRGQKNDSYTSSEEEENE